MKGQEYNRTGPQFSHQGWSCVFDHSFLKRVRKSHNTFFLSQSNMSQSLKTLL